MASIIYLQLDASYDPVFDPAVALTDLEAVEQAIETAILLFEGEWWEDLNLGTPMFQSILGARITPKNLSAIQLALSQRISSVPFVSAVTNIQINFNPQNRALSFTATAQTAFGTVKVSSPAPGSAAGLGT